jgi:hypothetical protein
MALWVLASPFLKIRCALGILILVRLVLGYPLVLELWLPEKSYTSNSAPHVMVTKVKAVLQIGWLVVEH